MLATHLRCDADPMIKYFAAHLHTHFGFDIALSSSAIAADAFVKAVLSAKHQ